MKTRLWVILLLGLATPSCGAPKSRAAAGPVAEAVERSLREGKEAFDHRDWHDLLASGTRAGRVDYAYFRQQRSALDAYLHRVARVDLGALAPKELQALLINAYNALTVRSILGQPEVASIRDIAGVWNRAQHTVGGYDLTLDAIEHQLLRPFFKDPRIHFAVNCASASCAPLPGWAYTGDRLEMQLEERTRSFLRDPANVRVAGDVVLVSRYFDWYGDDFTKPDWAPRADTVAGFIARYASAEVQPLLANGKAKLEYLEYDWSLNQAPKVHPGDVAR